MKKINIAKASQNLFQLVSSINISNNPITIVNNKGKNAVLISEDEWHSIEETLYLSFIRGYAKDVNKIRKTENWVNAEVYNSNEEW